MAKARAAGAGPLGGGASRGRGQVPSRLCLSKGSCRAPEALGAPSSVSTLQTRCGSGSHGKGVQGEGLDQGGASGF